MDIEGDTLLQIQKWWDAISSVYKRWPTYKNLASEHYEIAKFLLPPENHSKYITAKEKYKAFSIALRVHIVKDTTISSSKAPKSQSNL